MIMITACSKCKHQKGVKNFLPVCDAFPDGMPYSFDDQNVENLKECNNGIKFEPATKND